MCANYEPISKDQVHLLDLFLLILKLKISLKVYYRKVSSIEETF